MLSISTKPTQSEEDMHAVEEALKSDPTDLPSLMARAAIYEAKSDATAAENAYRDLLDRYPDFTLAAKHLTMLYAKSSIDNPQGMIIAAKAHEAFPGDESVTKAYGIIAYLHGDYAESSSIFQTGFATETKDPEVLYYLGVSQIRLNQTADGKKSLRQALDLGLAGNLAVQASGLLATQK
jgi:Flp pilus assembly protein TadD